MILPFPTRIPILKAFVFTCLLVLVQQLEHTNTLYSALTFAFFMISVVAFNTAGGFSRPSGSYIFFFSTLAVEVGTVYKALIGQPAQTNLENPNLLMSAHVGLISAMLLAAFVTRRIVKTQDGMAAVLNVRSINYSESYIGCLVLWFLMQYAGAYLPGAGGQILHGLNMINPFLGLGVFFGTIAAVRNSGGRRSTTPITIAVLLWMFYNGLLSFSKQGMFTPIVSWLIAASWARFRLRPVHFIVLISFGICAQRFFVPLSNLRNQGEAAPDRLAFVLNLATHPAELEKLGREWEPPSDLDWRMFYYGKPQGIWDRLSMLPNDSVLIAFSDQGHYFGLKAIRYYFENWVPHVIDPNKLQGVQVGGNAYMHEMGELADADTTTGISFSPTAELFHSAGWFAILVIAPFIYLLLFMSNDAVCGDVRRQPWGLAFILGFAHVAPEGGIGGAIMAIWLGNIGIIMAIFGCGYITPVLGMLFSGGDKELVRRSVAAPRPSQLQARQAGT